MAMTRDDLIALARQKAAQAGIPPALVPVFLGQIEQESGWNPRAVSSAGARGLGQLMPATAKSLGVADSFDPAQNLGGAARYFKQMLDQFGDDPGLALAAYNWGPGRVQRLVEKPNSVRIPQETQDYVPGVLAKAVKYGSSVAPTDATLAFFPGSIQATKDTVNRGVGFRLGKAPEADIKQQIATGTMPTGEQLAQAAPQPSMAPPMGPEMMGAPAPVPAAGAAAIAQVNDLDRFLRSRFGPVAADADAFPSGYDDSLMKLIEQA